MEEPARPPLQLIKESPTHLEASNLRMLFKCRHQTALQSSVLLTLTVSILLVSIKGTLCSPIGQELSDNPNFQTSLATPTIGQSSPSHGSDNDKSMVVSNESSSSALAEWEGTTLSPSAELSGQGQGQGQGGGGGGGSEGASVMMRSSITLNSVIFTIGLCGNTAVILVILKFTRIETVTDIYILNLAFADLMFVTGLVFLITTMTIDHWIFGNLMCKLYMATTSLNQFASSLLLVVMSFDRYLAVCRPIYAQRFRLPRHAKLICLCIWIICLILMTPIFAFAKISPELTCAIFWPDYKSFNCEQAFTIYSFGIGFAAPLLLIAAFYWRVIRKLRKSASGPIGGTNARRLRNRESTNRRIEHLVIGIICTYTICWLPYWIEQLWVSFTTAGEYPASFYLFVLIATSLSYTNSALNPILYAFLSDNFKRRFSEIFSSICSIKWLPCHRFATKSSNKTQPSTGNSFGGPASHTNVVGPPTASVANWKSSLGLVARSNTCSALLQLPEMNRGQFCASTESSLDRRLVEAEEANSQKTNKRHQDSCLLNQNHTKIGDGAINAHQHQSQCEEL